MAEDIFSVLFSLFGIAVMVWFLWLWPVRLNRALKEQEPSAKSFFFGFSLSTYMLSAIPSAPAVVLMTSFGPEEAALPSVIKWVVLLVGAVAGLIGYGLLRRRRIIWGGIIGIYWLWAFFLAYRAQEIEPTASAMALLFSAAILVPMTIYVKRRWHEFK